MIDLSNLAKQILTRVVNAHPLPLLGGDTLVEGSSREVTELIRSGIVRLDKGMKLQLDLRDPQDVSKPLAIFEHYKGGLVFVTDLDALWEPTKEPAIVYHHSGQNWVRPVGVFMSQAVGDDGTQVPRFREVWGHVAPGRMSALLLKWEEWKKVEDKKF